MSTLDYAAFLQRKAAPAVEHGFAPTSMPSFLFDFQAALVEWAQRLGRAAIFADCGLGKTPMQLVWADNVVRVTAKPALILTPLAVGAQTVAEAAKFGIEAVRSRDGRHSGKAGIVVANYEVLHKFSPADFGGIVCDESSILKHFKGATQQAVTHFMEGIPYRLLCTATAAPNDYVELGTSSEALGECGQVEMLSRFFRQDPKIHTLNERERRKKLALRGERAEHRMVVAGTGSSWRLKGHAVDPFWRWVCSWARACRKPSDLGFDDARFVLPPVEERDHVIAARHLADGMLFAAPAFGLQEERAERRRSLTERVEAAARLVAHRDPVVVWCHLNEEGDALERSISGAVQVRGADSDEAKEEAYRAFAAGQVRVLITKPKIGAWGLNWQHCAHVVTFASHSFEQHYQAVRRCWRFGQTRPVVVDVVYAEGERYVRENMARKAAAAAAMFDALVARMGEGMKVAAAEIVGEDMEVPAWL